MVVCTIRYEFVAAGFEAMFELLCVFDDLLLVLLELWSLSLLQRDRKCADGVIVGTALMAGEHGEVDRTFKVMAPLGPRKLLCVVVVTISAYSKGESLTSAAIKPEICAMSTIR